MRIKSHHPDEPSPPTAGAGGDAPAAPSHVDGAPADASPASPVRDIARQQMRRHLDWLVEAGITLFDAGLREDSTDTFIQKHHQSLDRAHVEGLVEFFRARNAAGWCIYIRPARCDPSGVPMSWPLVYLDDLTTDRARSLKEAYAAMVIETSPGRFQVWIRTTRPLTEEERRTCQRHLMIEIGTDPGSTSGEHFGRLAGFQNRKLERRQPDGRQPWVNVKWYSRPPKSPPWSPDAALSTSEAAGSPSEGQGRATPSFPPKSVARGRHIDEKGIDTSPSGREWGYVCGRLEFLKKIGATPQKVEDEVKRLTDELERRGATREHHDPRAYAEHTLKKARTKIGI